MDAPRRSTVAELVDRSHRLGDRPAVEIVARSVVSVRLRETDAARDDSSPGPVEIAHVFARGAGNVVHYRVCVRYAVRRDTSARCIDIQCVVRGIPSPLSSKSRVDYARRVVAVVFAGTRKGNVVAAREETADRARVETYYGRFDEQRRTGQSRGNNFSRFRSLSRQRHSSRSTVCSADNTPPRDL